MLKESKSSGSKMTPSRKWPAAAFLSPGKYRFAFNFVIILVLPSLQVGMIKFNI